MNAIVEQLNVWSPAELGALAVATLLLVVLVVGRATRRTKPTIRLVAKGHASRGLTVPAIARELGLSQDAVRLLLGPERVTRKIEPAGRNYRADRQPAPRKATRSTIGSRCDVSA
jgi:hypothetical protein